MSKRPAFQFYPADWRNEPGLRLCSMAARGMWMEMMCLMHEGAPYGHLTVNGRPMRIEELARLIGESAAQAKRWLAELDKNDVFSVNDGGVLFSRRMVRDEAIREARKAGGPAGAEHGYKGAAHGSKGGRPRKPETPLRDSERGVINPPPSSSSPSPSSEEKTDATASGGEPPKATTPLDLKAGVFGAGVPFLTAASVPEPKARQMLGKWRRDFGDGAVIDALAAANAQAASDPISFITATLGARNGKRNHGQGSWLNA